MKEFEGAPIPDRMIVQVTRFPRSVYHHVGSGVLVLRRPQRYTLLVLIGESGGPWRYKAGDYQGRAFTVNDATDVGITATDHGYHNVDGPFYLSTTGTLPGGLATGTRYWIRSVSATQFRFFTSYQNAADNVSPIDLTSAGSGTHTIGGLSATAPSASDTAGMGSVRLAAGATVTLLAPSRLTIVGTGASDLLTYYWA